MTKVVAAVLTGSDADLHNLADQAVKDDATQAVWALAKLAAAAMEQHARLTKSEPMDVLREVSTTAFGHTPLIQ